MIDQSNFSIFRNRAAPEPAPVPVPAPVLEPVVAAPLDTAPPPHPAPPPEPSPPQPLEPSETEWLDVPLDTAPIFEPEPCIEPPPEPAPFIPETPLQQAELPTVSAPADQLGLANPSVIAMVATLQDEEPAELTSAPTGVYRAVGDTPPAPPRTAEAAEAKTGLIRGTRILTAIGEIAVELLVLGDAALALRGPALLPIEWIGRITAPIRAIRIEAGALGENKPRRPLSLAPDHPVFIDPVPVPAHALVNGSTIQETDLEEAELFLIDVGSSEVLFAEGVPLSSNLRVELAEQPGHQREEL